MVFNPEEVTDFIPILLITQTKIREISARKSLCLFTNIFFVKKKISIQRVESTESKSRAIKIGNSLLTNKKRKGHSKINEQIKINLYAWITLYTRVFQSTTSNDFLKDIFDDQTEPQLVPKFLLQVSVRELHNILVSD